MAAPIGGQIFSEVLPYLEVAKDGETGENIVETVEVPDIVGLSIKDAKAKLKENELEININNTPEELDEENTFVKTQTPNAGIVVNKKSNVFIDI